MLFPRLVDSFLAIVRLKNDLIDRGQWLFNLFAMIQSRPRRYDQVFISRTISFFFIKNKQTSVSLSDTGCGIHWQLKVVERDIVISNSLEVQSLLKRSEDR